MAYALITGASSGLGVEFAHLFAADKHPLILLSSPRSSQALEKTAQTIREQYQVEVQTLSVDLAELNAAEHIYQTVKAQGWVVDYLVNNAGFGIVGLKVQEYQPQQFKDMLQVNVMALSELCMAFVPDMVARKQGKILNVSSIAGYIIPHGLEAGYSASKAYVVSFTEGLATDLVGTGVSCTHLAPGPTRTEFFNVAGLKNQARLESVYMQPKDVAQQGYQAFKRGKVLSMPGLSNKVMRVLATLSPSRSLVGKISGYLIARN